MLNIFRFGYRNGIYETEQFKLKVGRSFALVSNQLGDLVCLLLGAAICY